MTETTSSTKGVQRQVILPLSKAVEIAYKNIRMRLSRSLVVTSGIVLAVAFLMSIRVNEALVDGMRGWIAAFNSSPAFNELRGKRDALNLQAKQQREQVINAVAAAGKPAKGQAAFDVEGAFGRPMDELQKELGVLPVAAGELGNALTAKPEVVQPAFQGWIDTQRRLQEVKQSLTAPQLLAARMKESGVPTTPEEIENDRIQTQWLLGLALLVAFVGILNAMLMSVTERFREIGTMKCLGALDSFIIKLFLIESLFQGIVGTLLGILLGFVLSVAAILWTYGGYAWMNVPVGDILWSMLICLLVGVGLTVAGAVYPAWQAARMQPIEAMRVEA